MARLQLVHSRSVAKGNSNLAHRASTTEGEAAKRLMEEQGYTLRRTSSGSKGKQYEFRCPFHEGPGAIENRKSTNFYINTENSKYACQSAACGERGNLTTLERHFGIDIGTDDEYVASFQSREDKLKLFERLLTQQLRKPFYDHGLTDQTIERFRLGYEPEHEEEGEDGRKRKIPGRYVLPYLVGRRPKWFRYYSPDGDPKWKYTWESGAEGTLYNGSDAVGDDEGRVFLCEGEQKAMLLAQMGYAAVAVPGAGQWKDEFQAAFTHARHIVVCYDNDNPEHHIYDKPEQGRMCSKCKNQGLEKCKGHNPGQEAAAQRVDQLGWRAKNVVLPLPEGVDVRKTDINDFFVRDGHTGADFARLTTGKNSEPFKITSLADLLSNPPEDVPFIVEQGILPVGGRLLVAGAPKVGKSIFVDNLAMSIASGIPFLQRFAVDRPRRVMLLDRELSKRSLFNRLGDLMDGRVGYRAGVDNMLIDHDHLIRLDQPGAYDLLASLVDANGAEVVVLDTAYKFFGGDVESASSVAKAFEVLDRLIQQTGVSIVMSHHMRKRAAKDPTGAAAADPNAVVGSFLWTGWPNATVLLNYLNRSVEDPFNALCSFTAFRDAAPPEPLALYRDRTSINYTAITDFSYEDDAAASSSSRTGPIRPDTEAVAQLLLSVVPTTEADFLHIAGAHFQVKQDTIRPFLLDALSSGHFVKQGSRPAIIKFAHDKEEETWEAEHNLAPTAPPGAVDPTTYDQPLFDAAFDVAEVTPADMQVGF